MNNKNFKVGEKVYFYSQEDGFVASGVIKRDPHKAKEFVVDKDKTLVARVSEISDMLYYYEDLPAEAKDIVINHEEEVCCKHKNREEDVDYIVELEEGDCGVDAIDAVIEYALELKKDVVGRIIYIDGDVQYLFVSKDGCILFVSNDYNEVLKYKENKENPKGKDKSYKIHVESTLEDIKEVEESLNIFINSIKSLKEELIETFKQLKEIP